MPKRLVPKGWLELSAVGDVVEGTRFLPFKVPLNEKHSRNLKPHKRFTPAQLLTRYPNLRLIIDLTNTYSYYNGDTDFASMGVYYKKIMCPGQGKTPPYRIIQEFFKTVDEFLDAFPSVDSIIGVHCTHGINRTGFLICKYMVHRLGISSGWAIASFESARGHQFQRKELVDQLLALS